MENLLFLGVPILKHIRVSPPTGSSALDAVYAYVVKLCLGTG